jgi:hypothetical protein
VHVVVIHGWKGETTELAQAISGSLGITAFEARQRISGGGPIVVASFADAEQAFVLVKKLNHSGIATLVVNTTEACSRAAYVIVRRFELNESSLRVETRNRRRAEIPYREIVVLLLATSIIEYSETKTVAERKFSLGKTILGGGIPMSKKVEHQKKVATEERRRVLYLYASSRQQPIIFSQDAMTYDGLGAAMQISRDLNFTYLVSELRRRSPLAAYDDRLMKRVGQVQLLGPALEPTTNLDLAAEILARSLRP